MPTKKKDKSLTLFITMILWILAAWLLFPLINLDQVDMSNVKATIYRSALGLTLLIIFFGKTLLDLIYPWVQSRKLPILNAILLAVYALVLSGGIIFMILRMISLSMKSKPRGAIF